MTAPVTEINSLQSWLKAWQRSGSPARISGDSLQQIQAWIANGVSVDEQDLIVALPCPDLFRQLLAGRVQANQHLVQAIAERCVAWTKTTIASSQRMIAQEDRRQWGLLVIEIAERWPALDWYERLPNPLWRPQDQQSGGIKRPMRPRFERADQPLVPANMIIEQHIPRFGHRLVAARTKKGLAPGPQWSNQQGLDDALCDLLLAKPEMHSLAARERALQINEILDQGARIEQDKVVRAALKLGDKQVLQTLLQRKMKINADQHAWFCEWMQGGGLTAGAVRLTDDARRALVTQIVLHENENVKNAIDWTALVETPTGKASLSEVADRTLNGVHAKATAEKMDAKTSSVRKSKSRQARL